MNLITSRSNPKVKEVRALRQRKARRESGLILVEGIHPIGEAVEAGLAIKTIVYAPSLLRSTYAQTLIKELAGREVSCHPVSNDIFEWLAEKEHPQGILAVVYQPVYRLCDFNPTNFAWGVALVDPQDPGNVGTILRTMDAVGANGLLLLSSGTDTTGLVDPYQTSSVRASMGAIFGKPVIQTTFAEFSIWSQQYGYNIFGSSAHGAQDYQEINTFPTPRILLLGSEREGLTTEQIAVCDKIIRLPMHGRATSLNLAVAASILLYEMLRKS